MEKLIVDLGAVNGRVEVNIYRKKIKNVHLKVFRSLEIALSVPEQVPTDWIENFLFERASWIDEQMTKYKKSSGYNNLENIRNGSSTQYLGKDMRIYKEASLMNDIQIDEKRITLYLEDIKDEELAQRIFNRWWRMMASETYQRVVDELYESVFKKYGIKKPVISIRKMKTLWGSCTPSKCKITLNEYLLKADIRCIQYVALHELTHLLYQNHSSQFYDFLTIQMPDWMERKKRLDTEVVQGL